MTEFFSPLTIFLAVGGLGFLFLLASFLIGDLFEAVGFDFDGGGGAADAGSAADMTLLDSRVVSMFLTAFGGFGAVGAQMGYGAAVSSLFGMLGGVVFGAIVFFFGKLLYDQQSTSSVGAKDLVGRRAEVVVKILPGSIGQISCRIGEERVEKIARTEDGSEIKAGETVRIERFAGDTVVVSRDPGEGISLFSEKA